MNNKIYAINEKPDGSGRWIVRFSNARPERFLYGEVLLKNLGLFYEDEAKKYVSGFGGYMIEMVPTPIQSLDEEQPLGTKRSDNLPIGVEPAR